MHERDILLAALEKAQPDEREAYLTQACGPDRELRSRVDALLRASEVQDSFLEHPAAETELFGRDTDAIRSEIARQDELSLDFLQPSEESDAIGRIGHYEITEVIGRGGMGVVLKARDTKLNRVVAIKVMAPELASNPTARKRFQREAHAAAAVVHQHIVTIHAVEEDRLPYLVMECIVGQSLKEKIDREGHLPLVEILRIGQQVASGLAAAHAHGLIHRDVKPANILLENGVERVRITDFGLARAVDDVGMTRTGEVAGTPQFMSPEQAQGLPMDGRGDLFSLGCVLYAMCTGRPPFRAESAPAVLHRICHDTPRPIQDINPAIPDWLLGLIERLLQKDPAERFQSAKEVAELLGQYLAHTQQPAIVALPGMTRASQKRKPRVRLPYWSVAVIATFLVVALGLSWTEASGVTSFVPTVIRVVRGEGTLVIEVDDPNVQVSLDGEALSIRGAGLQELRLLPGKYRLHATKNGEPVKDEVVTISRDGRKVVSVTRESPGGSAATGTTPAAEQPAGELKLLAKLDGHSDLVRSVAFMPDGRRFVSVGRDKMVRIWDLKTRSILSTLPVEGYLRDADVSPDGRFIATTFTSSRKDAVVHVWDLERRQRHCELVQADARIECIRFSPDGTHIVTGGDPSGGVLWDLSTGKEVRRFNSDDLSATAAVAFSPDGRLLAIGAVGRLRLFGIESGDVVGDVVLPQPRGVFIQAFAHSGKLLACGQMGGHISLVDVEHREVTTSLPNSHAYVQCMQFLDNNRFLLSTRDDAKGNATLQVWDVARAKLAATATTEQGTNKRLSISPNGRYAISAGGEIWDEVSRSRKVNGDYALRLWQLPESVWPAGARPTSSPADTTNQTPKAETGAFVVLGGDGIAERKFDTLAAAVLAASEGDTIEIRGNGPFVTEPVVISNVALAIRAGDGFRPVIKLHPKDVEAGKGLLSTGAQLLLEGLELQRIGHTPKEPYRAADHWIVSCHSGAPLFVANCRFVANHHGICIHTYKQTPVVIVRNCELFSQQGSTVAWFYSSRGRLAIDNSVHVGKTALFNDEQDLAGASITLRHNTMLGKQNMWLDIRTAPPARNDLTQPNPIRVAASSNLFDSEHAVLQCDQYMSLNPLLDATEAEAQIRQILDWQDDRNVYPRRRLLYGLLTISAGFKPLEMSGAREPAGWQEFWGSPPDAEILSGHVRYEGGDLLGKAASNPEQLTAADFRLRPDSAGYRAGPDGKDLGANMDLVGPGAAYERWKKTSDYQEWRKEPGQEKSEESGDRNRKSERGTPTQPDP